MAYLRRFITDEGGQDLIEYTLLMALIAIAGAAIFANVGVSITSIWQSGNSTLGNAVNVAGGGGAHH